MMFAEARAASLTLLGDEGIHGEHRCLCRENFLGEDAMDLFVGVEAGVLQNDAAEIQVGGAPERGESDAAGGNSEEHQILDAARAQNQVQLVLRKRADSLLIDDEIFGSRDRDVESRGGSANNEEILFFHELEAGFRIRNFWMARSKSQSDVDDQKLFLARKIHRFGRVGDDSVGRGDKPKNSILDIKRKQSCFFRLQFHGCSFLIIISTTQDIIARPVRRLLHRREREARWCDLARARPAASPHLHPFGGRAILPGLRDGGTSMHNSKRAVSLFPAVLAAALSCVLAAPLFASGEDKPAAPATTPAPTAARPDREKKVYTNDDLDQMWPKPKAAASDSQAYPTSAYTPPVARRSAVVSRGASAPPSRENNPLWYAEQVKSLYAELERLNSTEESLRDFRDTGTDSGVTIGLRFDAPCDGITTDNEIQQLAVGRQEIEQQLNDLQDLAEQNGVPTVVFQDPATILQAARKPLSPAQERAALIERQSELLGKLHGVQNQLADMSSQAAAQGIVLLPPTPQWGGNLTTNLIQSLDERASQLQSALGENEDAARRAGLASSALP